MRLNKYLSESGACSRREADTLIEEGRVTVNGKPADQARRRPEFTRLTAIHPNRIMKLEGAETPGLKGDTMTGRLIDLIAPLGFGQRALVVAPAKAGKTTVLQTIAVGIAKNHPESQLFILLVDERPEEVSEMEMIGVGEVVASSFDHPPERHVADGGVDVVVDHPRVAVRGGRSDVASLGRQPGVGEELAEMDRSTSPRC